MPAKKAAQSSARKYWLFKSEPEAFSIDDLAQAPRKTTFWDGVRNYQARNFLRDTIQVGDRVLYYHSNAEPPCVVGTAEVVKPGYPDHTAFDPNDCHYDPKSDPDSPTWYMVDIRLLQKFPRLLSRTDLAACPELADMMVLKRGSRLSIQPVTEAEWSATSARGCEGSRRMTSAASTKARPTALLIIGVLLLALLAGWLVYRAVHTTWVYDYQVQFTAVPHDDRAVEDWLRSQPGVTAASVARDGHTLAIHFEMQSWKSEPDVISQLESFGYAGRSGFEGRVTSRW